MCLIAGHGLSSSGFQGAKVNIKWHGQVQTWGCQSKAVCGQSLVTMVGGERNVTKKGGVRGAAAMEKDILSLSLWNVQLETPCFSSSLTRQTKKEAVKTESNPFSVTQSPKPTHSRDAQARERHRVGGGVLEGSRGIESEGWSALAAMT